MLYKNLYNFGYTIDIKYQSVFIEYNKKKWTMPLQAEREVICSLFENWEYTVYKKNKAEFLKWATKLKKQQPHHQRKQYV